MPSTTQLTSFFLKTLITIASSRNMQDDIRENLIGAYKEKNALYGLSYLDGATQIKVCLCIESALSKTKKHFSQTNNDKSLSEQINKEILGLIPALVEPPNIYLTDDNVMGEEDLTFSFIKTNATKKLKELTPPSVISQGIGFFKTYRDELILATGLTALASATLLTNKR